MHSLFRGHVLATFLLLLLPACSSEVGTLDEKKYPYRLKTVMELWPNAQTADLDGDSIDEVVLHEKDPLGELESVVLRRQGGQIIEQVNYVGTIRGVHFLDHNQDGTQEVVVTYVRNDSLYASFIDASGQKLSQIFLTEGKPRQLPDGSWVPWDSSVENFYLADLDADEKDELITVVFTGYAQLPRGVLVHRLSDGSLLGKKIIGAAVHRSIFHDMDADGVPEIALETRATRNGAEANGFNDSQSYFIVVDFKPEPEVVRSRVLGNAFTQSYIAFDDFDGNGHSEFLSCLVSNDAGVKTTRFELIRPESWQTYQRLELAESMSWPQVVDLDRDIQPEIVVVSEPDEIVVIDHRFQVVRRQKMGIKLVWLEIWPDLDRDGIDEIAAITADEKVLLLTPELRVKAVRAGLIDVPSDRIKGVLHGKRGSELYPLVDMTSGTTVALELVWNPFYWFYRYGSLGLWLMGVSMGLSMVLMLHREQRHKRLLECFHSLVLDTDNRGVLLLNPRGRIERMNATLRQWLNLDGEHQSRRVKLDEVLYKAPALITFCQNALDTHPPRYHEDTLLLSTAGEGRMVKAVAEPIPFRSKERPHWLIHLNGVEQGRALQDNETWAMVVGKVAHEFKNPAAGLLLTAQQLQSNYRKHAPNISPILDPYAESIIERTEYLRRLSNNFMKFVGVEALKPVETDLNDFVRYVATLLEPSLASDISLLVKPSSAPPAVLIDRELMRTALENLIINAVNAMPEGGVITLATSVVSNLRTTPQDAPQDFVLLEVRDTGTGIARADRERLFELGFSTSEKGVGLGLAIVEKAVEDHGGFVEVESESGVGSVFGIYLPAFS